MSDRYLFIQIIIFIAAVVGFNFFERSRPGFNINKKNDLQVNILAMLIVILAGEYVKKVVSIGYDTVHLSSALSGNLLSSLPFFPKIFFAIAFSDFCLYWIHRAMHGPVRVLWNTHSFHHTIKEIWWLAGSRTSIIHLLLFAIPQVLIGFYLLQLNTIEATTVLCFSIVVNLWLHINVWVDIGPLEWLFITPNYHRIHHGGKGLMNKNIGFVLTIWDRMFGTYANPLTVGKNFDVYPVPTDTKRLLRMMVEIKRHGIQPEEVAKAVEHALTTRHPHPRYRIGQHRALMDLVRHLPLGIRDRIIASQLPRYGGLEPLQAFR